MPGVGMCVDGPALELAAYAFAEHAAAAVVVHEQGPTYSLTTQAGGVMHRKRPEVEIRDNAWRRAHDALQGFGLSPASRAKVEGANVVSPSSGPLSLDRFRELLGMGSIRTRPKPR